MPQALATISRESRLECCIPFCNRTIAKSRLKNCDPDDPGAEWICGKHWQAIHPSLKLRWRKIKCLWRKAERYNRHGPKRMIARWGNKLWETLKAAATEGIAGI